MGLAAAVAIAAAGGAGGGLYRSKTAAADPATVALPPAPAAPATSTYLTGPSKPVVKFAAAVPPSLHDLKREQCLRIAEALDATGKPAELDDVATAIPDSAVRDGATSAIATTVTYLRGCLDSAPDDSAARSAEFHLTVLRRLLTEAGVPA